MGSRLAARASSRRVIAIDWERMRTTDPAGNLGWLAAEVSYSTRQYGGDSGAAAQLLQFIGQAYCQGLPPDRDAAAILHRARFYQASSTLRMARSGWVPRQQRTALVGEALALLT